MPEWLLTAVHMQVRAAFSSVFSIPFNSKNKWALNMVRIPGDADNYLVLIKGAPEYVIKKCGRYFYRDNEHVLDDDFVEDMMEAYQSFGTLAERVIGHAFKVCSDRRMSPRITAACLDPRCQPSDHLMNSRRSNT